MKIVNRPAFAPPRPTPSRAVGAAGAFETLLRVDDQARGFQDLGMFGHRPDIIWRANVEPQGGSELPPVPPAEREVPAASSAPTPLAPAMPRLPAYAEAVAQAVAREAAGPASPVDWVSICVDPAVEPEADAVTRLIAPDAKPTDTSASVRPAPVVLRVRPVTGSAVSLVVADHQGALRVAIAGLAVTSSDLARLKTKIAELAVEFGLNLSELSVNGDRFDVSTPLVLGGAHGDHAR